MVALAVAGWLRFHDLGASALRSDEINFYFYAVRGQRVVDLWMHPPWLEHIPLADSLAAGWQKLRGGRMPTEGSVRFPFALLGWLTVALGAWWLWRRGRHGAACLWSVWVGLLPFHVYQSREAYYYGLAMLGAAGLAGKTADVVRGIREMGRAPGLRETVAWGAWAGFACLCHSTVWAVAAGWWLLVAMLVLSHVRVRGEWRSWGIRWGWMTGLFALWMSRWVWRAVEKVTGDFSGDKPLIGNSLGWLLGRVGPLFAGGVNVAGWAILGGVFGMAGWVAWRLRKQGKTGRAGENDGWFGAMGWVAGVGVVCSVAYVGVLGGGTAKWVYFAAALPAFLGWGAVAVEEFWMGLGGRARAWGMTAMVAVVAGALGWGAWETTRLQGKPTPYRELAAALDAVLEEGDAAIVDRWYEPWNEMAVYAPEKAVAWFTVPDEPYESYVQGRWRETTQRYFEEGKGLGFVRLSRNHEARMGLWTWPERWFAHRTVVTNEAGAWLTKTGYAPMEEFYLNPSRVQVEIFYGTREETAAKVLAKGRAGVAFFGAGWRLVKPWQQGDFRDYRVLERDGKGMVEVWRKMGAAKERRRISVTGTGIGGEATVRAGRGGLMRFRPGEISTQVFEEPLAGGKNEMEFAVVGGSGGLAVLEVGVE